MKQVTLEKVVADVRTLPLNERKLLRAYLDDDIRQHEGFRSIEEIAREQGKQPVSFQQLLGPVPDVDGEDDFDVDEFVRQVRQWRQEWPVRELD